MKPSPTPLILIAATVLLNACSLRAGDTAKIRLEIEGRGPPALSDAQWPIEFTSAPTSIDDMSCLMLNVMARDIEPLKAISRDVPYNFDIQYPKLLAGDACASYAGIISKFIPVKDGGVVEVNVPTGTKRLIQVLGAKTSSSFGCPNETYVDSVNRLGKAAVDGYVPDLYEVARAKTDVLGDLNLNITNSYTEANPNQVTHCGGDGGSGGNSYDGQLETGVLKVFLRGGGHPSGPITNWANSFADGLPGPFTQGTLNFKPSGGLSGEAVFAPAVHERFLSLTPATVLNSNAFTWIFAVKFDTSPTPGTRALIETVGGGTATFRGIYTTNANVGDPVHLKIGEAILSSGGGSAIASATAIGTSSWHIITLAGSITGATRLYIDGGLDLTVNFASRSVVESMILGSTASGQTSLNSLSGSIGDVLLYNDTIGGQYLVNSQCFLAKRWGISNSVLGCHS